MFSSNGSQVSSAANYIEDVFSTYLYTGNGSTQTITNNIDLSTKGGLVWIKGRNQAWNNYLYDTNRGVNKWVTSNGSGAQSTDSGNLGVSAFNTSGFSLGDSNGVNNSSLASTYASWTFRKQPKFFDVVTFTTGASGTYTFNHNLGSVPGCVMIKSTGNVSDWNVYHQSIGVNSRLFLNQTSAKNDYTGLWGTPTSTTFTGDIGTTLEPNQTHVAYLFASNAGGFGLTGTDNVISCGSFTTDGSGGATVSLGYEPQWVMTKCTSTTSDWRMFDNMRGMSMTSDNLLRANTSGAESTGDDYINPTATGFVIPANGNYSASQTFIYIAIRRGPMKVPTDATKVFTQALKPTNPLTVGFPMDFEFWKWNDGTQGWYVYDRLRGNTPALNFNTTNAENTSLGSAGGFDSPTNTNNSSTFVGPTYYMGWYMRRAPSFFDEVCYDGTGATATTQTHNLGATPEFMIIKSRNTGSTSWVCYHKGVNGGVNPQNYYMLLQSDQAQTALTSMFNDTAPTSSVFTVGPQGSVGASGRTYVAYLFATCAGVSKVGSYTGTGATQTISCGFTGGARFVLVKRTDSTGDWYVWDTARGMVSGTDPSLLLNSTAAEVNANSIYTTTGGFQIVSTAAGINASGGTYIFLAIA